LNVDVEKDFTSLSKVFNYSIRQVIYLEVPVILVLKAEVSIPTII